MQLNLQLGEVVQGSVTISKRNLMLVFQVNCPGCLSKALPQLIKISDVNQDVNCFAMSTAFENFNLNNIKTTTALVETGELTLHAKRYFSQLGQQKLPYKISVPIIMDWFMPSNTPSFLAESVINALDQERLSETVKQNIKKHLGQRLIPMSQMGRTFLNNDLQGTPTWIYFDQDLNVIESWFGHKELEWVQALLDR